MLLNQNTVSLNPDACGHTADSLWRVNIRKTFVLDLIDLEKEVKLVLQRGLWMT